jgi:RNase P subunit RPR2
MADHNQYRRQLVERLEREKSAAQDEIARAQADEARARAKVAEKAMAITNVLAAREPQADECKRCRFEFGRTSVLRPMPSKSKVARFQCALCGAEEERA